MTDQPEGKHQDWIGRTFCVKDVVSQDVLNHLEALFDRPQRDVHHAPPLAHWLHCLPVVRQSELGSDGHPRLGIQLPDLGLPRRMWAASRIRFHQPLAVGSTITRRTTVRSIDLKHGSTGPLGFVTLQHETSSGDALLISEEQTLVYREAAGTNPVSVQGGQPAPNETPKGERVAGRQFNAVELFRFSALTANAHRIHYDKEYAINTEGYSGLVVHGPFQAMVLMDQFLNLNPEATVTGFEFRATAPLFANEQAHIHIDGANPATMRIYPAGRGASMTAMISAE